MTTLTSTNPLSPIVIATGVSASGPTREVSLPDQGSFKSLIVQIEGIVGDTVDIEGSLDGENWLTMQTCTADAVYSLPFVLYIRLNVTTYSSGNITGWVRAAGLLR